MKLNQLTFLALLFGMTYLVGCSGARGVEKQIDAFIERNCAGRSSCELRLQGATPFAWDKMYVFKYSAQRSEIEFAIGSKLKTYHELRRYLIFTKAGTVVYSEDEPTNVEHPIRNEIVFAMPDSANYQEYGADTLFMVSQESSKGEPYYLLKSAK